ncbi:MAG: ferrochelatase, partial [Xanthomonas perforans]|nr:ferrochelatase [Xanthomonas perforans]
PEIAVEVIQDYCEDASWVAAIADSIRAHWQAHGRSEKLMFSFHGLPQRVANAGDPYPQQCERSAQAIVTALGLGADEWQMGYQSRFGSERWLQPYAEP